MKILGISSVGLERYIWDVEVARSSRAYPTNIKIKKINVEFFKKDI